MEDGDFDFCLPDDIEYCGNGVSCPNDECWLDSENYYWVAEDEKYCGGGVICGDGGACFNDLGTFYCVPNNMDYCGNGLMCKKDEENCVDDNGKYNLTCTNCPTYNSTGKFLGAYDFY